VAHPVGIRQVKWPEHDADCSSGSGSCPIVEFGITSVDSPDSVIRELIT
jgi:hypothetical protein